MRVRSVMNAAKADTGATAGLAVETARRIGGIDRQASPLPTGRGGGESDGATAAAVADAMGGASPAAFSFDFRTRNGQRIAARPLLGGHLRVDAPDLVDEA